MLCNSKTSFHVLCSGHVRFHSTWSAVLPECVVAAATETHGQEPVATVLPLVVSLGVSQLENKEVDLPVSAFTLGRFRERNVIAAVTSYRKLILPLTQS